MSALRPQALQPLNSGQLNARANNITPVKSVRRTKENVAPSDQNNQRRKRKNYLHYVKHLHLLSELEMVEIIVEGLSWVKVVLLVVSK